MKKLNALNRRRHGKTRRGFTLLEFLIAASLTLLVLGMAVEGLIGAQRASKLAADEEFVTRIATSVLDRAKAFDCGTELAPDTTPLIIGCDTLLPSAGQAVTVNTPGQGFYKGDYSATASLDGGFASSTGTSRKLTVNVALSSYRVPTSGATSVCGSPVGTTSNVLRRVVDVVYTDREGNKQRRQMSVVQALGGASSYAAGARSLTVPSVPTGSRPAVVVTMAGTDNKLMRFYPSSCPAGSTVVLNGLLPGSYTASWFALSEAGVYSTVGSVTNWTV